MHGVDAPHARPDSGLVEIETESGTTVAFDPENPEDFVTH